MSSVVSRSARKSKFPDPRWVRSREALTKTILELASERPIHKISVREVAKRAGIDRTTFYNHAQSPEALLRETLLAEVELVYLTFRAEFAETSLSPFLMQEMGFRRVLKHIIDRQNVYRLSLSDGSSSLVQEVIGAQITVGAREMLNDGLYPFEPPLTPTTFQKEFAASVAVGGLVGGIITWLIQDGKLNPDEFIESFQLFLPAWFTMANAR